MEKYRYWIILCNPYIPSVSTVSLSSYLSVKYKRNSPREERAIFISSPKFWKFWITGDSIRRMAILRRYDPLATRIDDPRFF